MQSADIGSDADASVGASASASVDADTATADDQTETNGVIDSGVIKEKDSTTSAIAFASTCWVEPISTSAGRIHFTVLHKSELWVFQQRTRSTRFHRRMYRICTNTGLNRLKIKVAEGDSIEDMEAVWHYLTEVLPKNEEYITMQNKGVKQVRKWCVKQISEYVGEDVDNDNDDKGLDESMEGGESDIDDDDSELEEELEVQNVIHNQGEGNEQETENETAVEDKTTEPKTITKRKGKGFIKRMRQRFNADGDYSGSDSEDSGLGSDSDSDLDTDGDGDGNGEGEDEGDEAHEDQGHHQAKTKKLKLKLKDIRSSGLKRRIFGTCVALNTVFVTLRYLPLDLFTYLLLLLNIVTVYLYINRKKMMRSTLGRSIARKRKEFGQWLGQYRFRPKRRKD